MYYYEISDILFFIKCLKNPTESFNINYYFSFFQEPLVLPKQAYFIFEQFYKTLIF